MTETKDKITKTATDSLIPNPNYIFTQCLMFVIHYGFGKTMPVWAVWFPTITYATLICVILLILLVGLIVSVFTG